MNTHFFSRNAATDVPRCKKGDSDCMVKSANIIMKAYSQGMLISMSSKTSHSHFL